MQSCETWELRWKLLSDPCSCTAPGAVTWLLFHSCFPKWMMPTWLSEGVLAVMSWSMGGPGIMNGDGHLSKCLQRHWLAGVTGGGEQMCHIVLLLWSGRSLIRIAGEGLRTGWHHYILQRQPKPPSQWGRVLSGLSCPPRGEPSRSREMLWLTEMQSCLVVDWGFQCSARSCWAPWGVALRAELLLSLLL